MTAREKRPNKEARQKRQNEGASKMSDLRRYITKRKKTDKTFADGFDVGYEEFKKVALLELNRGQNDTHFTPESNAVPAEEMVIG